MLYVSVCNVYYKALYIYISDGLWFEIFGVLKLSKYTFVKIKTEIKYGEILEANIDKLVNIFIAVLMQVPLLLFVILYTIYVSVYMVL